MYKYSPSGTLLWSVDTSVPDGAGAFSPDGADLVLTGSPPGGASWVTAVFDTATGARRWLVSAPEGNAAIDVLADSGRVYVAGQGVTGAGTPAIAYFMTVVAYDRATGARLWRTDKKPADGASAAGLWMAKTPGGSFVVTGQASRGFLDWYTVAFETTGAVRWEAVRDGGLNTDEIPRSVFVLADGTTVVTGPGGPNLPGGYIQGVTAGYSSTGALLWEAFSPLATVWAAALPSGDVCATGGYDALITCFQVSGGISTLEPVAVMSTTPSTGTAPLTVAFDGSGSIPRGNPLVSWTWSFGDGSSGSGVQTSHVYLTPGSYMASLTVTDSLGVTSIPATTSIVVSVARLRPPRLHPAQTLVSSHPLEMPHRHPARVITTDTRPIPRMLMPMTHRSLRIPIAVRTQTHPVQITARISTATIITTSTYLQPLSSRVFRCASMRAPMQRAALRRSACNFRGMAAQRGRQPSPPRS